MTADIIAVVVIVVEREVIFLKQCSFANSVKCAPPY